MDDQSLLALLREDPERGLSALMERYLPLVAALVRGRLDGVCPRADMEECVSDVFSQLYLQRNDIDLSRGTIKAYLCAIARNKSADVRRAAGRYDPLPEGWDVPEEDSDAETLLLRRERRQAVVQAVLRLDNTDREIIVRKYFFRQPSAAVAKEMGMTVSAVDTRTHRALKKLRAILGEETL